MKRISYALLIACFLLATFAILPVSAYTGEAMTDEQAVAAGIVIRIGEPSNASSHYFWDLNNACYYFSDVLPDEEVVFTLINDTTSAPYTNFISEKGKHWTIDLNGHTLTFDGADPLMNAAGFTFKNGTIVLNCKKMYIVDGEWNFENVTIQYSGTDACFDIDTRYGNPSVVLDGVTFNNCPNGYPMFVRGGAGEGAIDIDIIDSTISKTANFAWGAANNVFYTYGTGTTVNLDIKGSELSVVPTGAVGADYCQVLNADEGTTLNVTVDDKSTFELASNCATNMFIGYGAGATVNLTDNGATWKAAAAIMAAGVTLPTATAAAGETIIGYKAGDSIVPNGKTGCQATFDTAVSFKKVSFTAADFANVDGASIRLSDPYGIRFTTNVSKALIDVLGESATYGTLVIPTELLGNASFTKAVEGVLDIPTAKWAARPSPTLPCSRG